jgi:hypothetical protein
MSAVQVVVDNFINSRSRTINMGINKRKIIALPSTAAPTSFRTSGVR